MLHSSGAIENTYAVLIRHFFGRFFDKEALSPQAEAEVNLGPILGLLAAPGAFMVLLLLPLGPSGWSMVTIRYCFVSFSMIVMAFIVICEWDALFPDRRDYQILMPLPLRLSTLFLTKIVALALFLSVFLVGLNFFGTLLLPVIDTRPGASYVYFSYFAHFVAVFGGGLFAALAAASVQGILISVLSGNAFRRVSVCLQTLLLGMLVMLFFLTPLLGHSMKHLVTTRHLALFYFPTFWFVGLYESLCPATRNPLLISLGSTAIQALWWAAGVFLLTYLPGYRRHARKILETPQTNPAGAGFLQVFVGKALDRLMLRQPVQRAVFHFISQTIARSVKHRLFLTTYGGFGIALAVLSLGSDASAFLKLPLMLSFVMISGLRAAFNFPSELRANWAYQVSELGDVAEYIVAMRKWIVACAILPLFLLIAPFEFLRFPWTVALFHIAFGITLAVLLMELMFFGFRKVPFTCSYFPGKINFVGLSVIYIFGFTTYSRLMARLEVFLISMPTAAVAFFVAAVCVHVILTYGSRRKLRESIALDYEDAADPQVRTLGLGYY